MSEEIEEQSKSDDTLDLSCIGVVIPTQGNRLNYLNCTIHSLQTLSPRPFVILAAPSEVDLQHYLDSGMVDMLENDLEQTPLASKIDTCLNRLPDNVKFITWIGDDDLINLHGMREAMKVLENRPDVGLVYGQCRYIDSQGNLLFTRKPMGYAKHILGWGPQLIAQPATLYRRSSYGSVGGLSPDYTHAFDFDIFLKMHKVCSFEYIPVTMASWRWHDDSLTISKRWTSASEASKARRTNQAAPKLLIEILDWPVRLFTYLTGKATGFLIRFRSKT